MVRPLWADSASRGTQLVSTFDQSIGHAATVREAYWSFRLLVARRLSVSTRRTTCRLASRFEGRSKVARKVTGEHCRARHAPALEGNNGRRAIGKNPVRRPPQTAGVLAFLRRGVEREAWRFDRR